MPLNPELYSAIRKYLGDVAIANEGIRTSGSYIKNPLTGRLEYKVIGTGEQYKMNCPFCNDTRKRLYVNYRYGTFDEQTKSSNYHLAICFNEDCLREPGNSEKLKTILCDHHNRNSKIYIFPHETTVANTNIEIILPGVCTPLHKLEYGHFARAYIRSRGYDDNEIGEHLDVSYCVEAESRYPLANARIVIPTYMHSKLKGWQCRYIGDRDWSSCSIPKYYTCPGMKKTEILYNFDYARNSEYVVVCEGPTDVWSIGPEAIALWGKVASEQQKRLILANWKKVIIILDSDADEQSNKLLGEFRTKLDKNVIRIQLQNKDPGNYSRNYLSKLIHKALESING